MATTQALTLRQHQALTILRAHIAERGYPPSIRELAAALGLRSPSSAHHLLTQLEAKGHIRRQPHRPRALDARAEQRLGELRERP